MKRLVQILILACCWAIPAHAQDSYPSRPVTIVAPFGPGSATDIFTRVVAQGLQEEIGQSVVVENKPGGNAAIAAEYVKNAAPDGYTLMMSTASAHASNVHLLDSIPYDPLEDFEPVAWIGTVGFFVAVSADSPYQTIADLIEDAKAKPGELTFGTANASGIVTSQSLTNWAGLDMIHVPYPSSPQAMLDLMGGRLTVMIADTAAAAEQLGSGQIRALAMSAGTRSKLYPDVPTLAESGLEGFDLIGWFGVYAPAGTPQEVVELLNSNLKVVMEKAEVQEKLNKLGYEVFATSPEELERHTRQEIDRWGEYVEKYDLELK